MGTGENNGKQATPKKTGKKPESTEGPRRLSKSASAYWRSRIRKLTWKQNGELREAPEWSVRIQHRHIEKWINLGTGDKHEAASRAKVLYQSILSLGWEKALIEFRPGGEVKPKSPTVGQFLAAAEAVLAVSPKTKRGYVYAFRRVVAGVKRLDGEPEKHSRVGSAQWRARVDRVKLDYVTPDRVERWIREFVGSANNPVQQDRRRASVNSYVRNAKALFNERKVLRHLSLSVPRPHPFDGIETEPEGDHRYRAEVNPELLLIAGKRELDPDQLTVLVLGLLVGLRRLEIDRLAWQQLDLAEARISIRPTAFFRPKSRKSSRSIPIEPEVVEFLRARMSEAKSLFVISGTARRTRGEVTADNTYYRCERTFRDLTRWLRSKGVSSHSPIHDLRKEYGSRVAMRHDVLTASRALGHSDLRTTAEHYVESRISPTTGLGGSLGR